MKSPIAREPILTTIVAALIAWAAARYGFKVSPDQAAALAGVVLVAAGPYARQLVTPTSKLEYKVVPGELVELKADPPDQFTAPLKGNIQVRDPSSSPTVRPAG